MEIPRNSCRLCLSSIEFNISLFSSYCQKTNVLHKITTCYDLVIKESDNLINICYNCAANVEKYYDSIVLVKKSQEKVCNLEKYHHTSRSQKVEGNTSRRVTSYRQHVSDADYTFSVLDVSFNKEFEEPLKSNSSAFFSYFSSPNVSKTSINNYKWKTPKTRNARLSDGRGERRRDENLGSFVKTKRQSKDIFDTQSQDLDNELPNVSMDWKLTPDEEIMKRVRDKCFGRSDF